MKKRYMAAVAFVIILIAVIAFYLMQFLSYNSFNSNTVVYGAASSPINLSYMNYAKGYGVNWIRMDVFLNNSNFANTVEEAPAANMHILGILDYDTLGVVIKNQSCIKDCNWSLNDWNASVTAAVNKYPTIHYWEIWNEPQFPLFQNGFQNGDPYNYSLMLKSAYKIIKSHDSSDQVLCMGGDNIFVYPGNQTALDFLWARYLWIYNGSKYCDIVSLHMYSEGGLLSDSIPNTNVTVGQIFFNNLDFYENLTKKPIWITETGIPSNINTSSYGVNGTINQAIFANQTFYLLSLKPYIKGVFWFDLTDENTSKYNYGMFTIQHNPKPTANFFKQYSQKYG